MPDLVVRSRRVVLPGGVQPAAIHITQGRISAVLEYLHTAPRTVPLLEEGDRAVSPGLLDTHVHINQPGRTHWEGFESATLAAAAGGVTTLVDMPLNSIPPTTTLAGFRRKLEAAAGHIRVDVGFYGGVIPGNQSQLELLHAAGVLGFKCFMTDSGVPEFPSVTPAELKWVLPGLKKMGSRLLAHAELAQPGPTLQSRPAAQRREYRYYLESRPESWEEAAVRELILLVEETRCPVHVVHLASASALEAITQARRRGLPITVETCPHYLCASAGEIPDGATLWKCAPPIREAPHREALWTGLERGQIDSIASDHSPSPPELKALDSGDFSSAWGGISSLQLTLPLVWTEAQRRGFGLGHIAGWLSDAPARLVALSHRKGRIAPGQDADLVIWEPEQQWQALSELLYHRHPISPYLGRTLMGRVRRTLLRGEVVYCDGQWPGQPRGRLLMRPAGGRAMGVGE